MFKKAFTLVEILIVVGLFGLLSGIILQTYTTISRISYRIQQEKEIAKEALVFTQVLENLAQTSTIDYSEYDYNTLQQNNGLPNILALENNEGEKFTLETEGVCFNASDLREKKQKENGSSSEVELSPVEDEDLLKKVRASTCKLVLKKEGEEIPLLESKKFNISQAKFKIIPFISNQKLQEQYETNNNRNLENLPAAGKPGFWIFITLTSKHYTPNQRSNNVILPLQTFVSLQGNTKSIYSLEQDEQQTN